jgi:predicted secreted protein
MWLAEALPFSTIAKETPKMKTLKSALLFATTLILVWASAGLAQEQQAQDTDTLRDKVSEIERIDIAAKPASQQMIYKRARLNVYLQFQSSLEREIADLTNTQSAIGNDADLQRDVAGKLQELKRERKSISEKIQTLKSSLQTTASAGAAPAATAAANHKRIIYTPAYE